MKKSEWLEFKRNLKHLLPVTRLNYLKELLKKEEDKKIKAEIKEEIKEAKEEIKNQETKIENIPGIDVSGLATAEELTISISEQPKEEIKTKTLDSMIANMPVEEEKEKQTNYGGKGEYVLKYEGSKTPREMRDQEDFFRAEKDFFESSRERTEQYTPMREIALGMPEESESLKRTEVLESDRRLKYERRKTPT